MADIIITTTAAYMKIDFNGSPLGNVDEAYRSRSQLSHVELRDNTSGKGSYVALGFADGDHYMFDHTAARGPKVGTVGGVSVTSNTDLVAKLTALL